MRLFVTGGTGFIGSHFIRLALDEGHEVIAVRRCGSAPAIELKKEPIWIDGDFGDVPPTELGTCEVLVHFAAQGVQNPGAPDWERCIDVNIVRFQKLLSNAISAGIRRYVVAGSCFEYGNSAEDYEFIPNTAPLKPTGSYHATKAAATMIAHGMAVEHGLEMSILRPFHIFGEGEAPNRLWPQLKKAAAEGRDLNLTAGDQIRDFLSIEDAAVMFLEQCKARINPGVPVIRNLGTGNPMSIRQFAELWWSFWNAKGELRFGAIPYRDHEVMRYVPDIASADR
jgi:nucleoside-diphosphate-sugar epimerase